MFPHTLAAAASRSARIVLPLVLASAALAVGAPSGSAEDGRPCQPDRASTCPQGQPPSAPQPAPQAPANPGTGTGQDGDQPCECTKVDASLDPPTAAEQDQIWIVPRMDGFRMYRFAVDAELTCSKGNGGCVGDVVLSGGAGVRLSNTKRNSRVIECEGPCGATTHKRDVIPVWIANDVLDDAEPVDVEITIHAYCPLQKATTKPKVVTLNYLHGKFRPRFSDLDGDGKPDRSKPHTPRDGKN